MKRRTDAQRWGVQVKGKEAMNQLERNSFAKRLTELQQVVRAELAGKVFTEQEVAQLVRESAKDNS